MSTTTINLIFGIGIFIWDIGWITAATIVLVRAFKRNHKNKR